LRECSEASPLAYELGKRIPNLLILLDYARLAGIHVDDLIDDNVELNLFLIFAPRRSGGEETERPMPRSAFWFVDWLDVP
jgi:hypothetical protein